MDTHCQFSFRTKSNFDCEILTCLLANFNSFAFDFVTRQKVQATHLTWYLVEQLPVIAPSGL